MESRILLKITSILMIIMGGVTLGSYLALLIGVGLSKEVLSIIFVLTMLFLFIYNSYAGLMIVLTITFLFSAYAAFMIVSGILGLVFNRRDDKMKVIRLLGIIMFALQLLGFIGVLFLGANILMSLLGLLLSGLYILGAKDYS